jgi:hypothetical protein
MTEDVIPDDVFIADAVALGFAAEIEHEPGGVTRVTLVRNGFPFTLRFPGPFTLTRLYQFADLLQYGLL